MSEAVPITEIVEVIRSKNAGPFLLTLDLFFIEERDYKRVRDGGIITGKIISELYNIEEKDVLVIQTFDRVKGLKITIRRTVPAGDVGDTDVYGSQQHAPLLEIKVPRVE